MSCLSESNDNWENCVVFSSYLRHRGPDFARAKLVILSHADWFGCIWMTVLTSSGISSCLCALHSSLSCILKKAGCYISIPCGAQAKASWSFACSTHTYLPMLKLTNINRKLFSIGTTLYAELLKISSVTLSVGSPWHSEPLARLVIRMYSFYLICF